MPILKCYHAGVLLSAMPCSGLTCLVWACDRSPVACMCRVVLISSAPELTHETQIHDSAKRGAMLLVLISTLNLSPAAHPGAQVYAELTVLLAKRVMGKEEVPEGCAFPYP